MGYNRIILQGNLTRDPELKFTPDGKAVCKFSIAVNNPFDKEKKDVLFISIIAWGKSGENAAKFLSKGSSVLVDGRLSIRNWEKDGVKRQTTEVNADVIQYLGSPGGRKENPPAAAGSPPVDNSGFDNVPPPDGNDDVPF